MFDRVHTRRTPLLSGVPIAKLLILHNARRGDIQCAVYVIDFFFSEASSNSPVKKIAPASGKNDNETERNYSTDKNFNLRYSHGINEKMR